MRKQRFCMMGIVMALAMMIAPPLIGAQAHATMKSVDYVQQHGDRATQYSVPPLQEHWKAPDPTKAGNPSRLLIVASVIVTVLFAADGLQAIVRKHRRRSRPRSEVAAGVASSARALYSGG